MTLMTTNPLFDFEYVGNIQDSARASVEYQQDLICNWSNGTISINLGILGRDIFNVK